MIRKLRLKKAPGPDGIPAEYWKDAAEDPEILEMLGKFTNMCWTGKRIPSQWHEAHVAAIHKKGSVDLCENYRPISLLCIGYRVFAALIKERLVQAGAEARLSRTQFRFRSGYGTSEAIFVVRRKIESAWALKNGQAIFLALDWQAFDSIVPSALMAALKRFGLPEHVRDVIAAIYADRSFTVKDCGQGSTSKKQRSGISQGCPLSPFLFVILMSVLMEDAVHKLSREEKEFLDKGILAEVLYADDTLLIGVNGRSVQRFLQAVSDAGAAYGLSLHWGKLQLMQVRCSNDLLRPDCSKIEAKDTMTYLGTCLSSDGRISQELAKRLGLASADFRAMARMWKHTTLSRKRKLETIHRIVICLWSPRLL